MAPRKPRASSTTTATGTATTAATTAAPNDAPDDGGKAAAIAALCASLAADLHAVAAAAHAAHDAATHPEAKPENDKDTRALEAGYLAGAQSARAAELQRTLVELQQAPASAFALFALRETIGGRTVDSLVLLSPWGGGQKLAVGAGPAAGIVTVVTPKSPLGAALAGQPAGATVDVETGPRVRTLTVRGVS
jgi:hypothetical protein